MNVWHAGGQMQIPTASWADPYEPAAKFYVFALLKEKVLFFGGPIANHGFVFITIRKGRGQKERKEREERKRGKKERKEREEGRREEEEKNKTWRQKEEKRKRKEDGNKAERKRKEEEVMPLNPDEERKRKGKEKRVYLWTEATFWTKGHARGLATFASYIHVHNFV